MCEKGNGEAQHVSPLLSARMNPCTNPTTSRTLVVKDKEAAANWSLNPPPVSPLAHSKPPRNLCGTRLPFASKYLISKILFTLFLQTFPSVPPAKQFGTGLIFPEPPAAIRFQQTDSGCSQEDWPAVKQNKKTVSLTFETWKLVGTNVTLVPYLQD